MDEEDTFRKLKKIPYPELRTMLQQSKILETEDSLLVNEYLAARGWTSDELMTELINELKSNGFQSC